MIFEFFRKIVYIIFCKQIKPHDVQEIVEEYDG